MTTAQLSDAPPVRLVNPSTGVKFEFRGRWLRPGRASDNDIRAGRARFRGDQVWLNLPPGVQKQLDAGRLQIDTEYDARQALEASQSVESLMPRGNASQETWMAYAISQGMSRDEAAKLTRDQIKARFTAPVFDPDAPPEGGDGDDRYEMLS